MQQTPRQAGSYFTDNDKLKNDTKRHNLLKKINKMYVMKNEKVYI